MQVMLPNNLPAPTSLAQPEITVNPIIAGLPFKKTRIKTEWHKRVLFLDPSDIYSRVNIRPYERVQTHLTFAEMFPAKPDAACACGCGAAISGRRRRWASDDCTKFATTVWAIIDGQAGTISTFVKKYYGAKCSICGTRKELKADHIIPVKHGGGGCWLSNFQLLCHFCHVAKTNKDFGWKQNITEGPLAESKADAPLFAR